MRPDDEVLDVHAVAKLIHVHPETIRRKARAGEMPAFKAGRDWRFSRKQTEEWAGIGAQAQRKLKILIVDDDARIRNTLRAYFEGTNCGILEAENGKEGVRLVEKEDPDAVILDLKMPVMHGAQALCEIRQHRPALPVIILTAYADGELLDVALKYSPFILQEKPAEREQILNALRMSLGAAFIS